MQRQAAVKLYGVFACGLKVLDCAPVKSISPDISRGQWSPRWTIHASRQLSDKVLRYLKRVIVTPAVYWSFARLKPGLSDTSTEQDSGTIHNLSIWQSPMFLLNSRSSPGHCDQIIPNLALLLPKLRSYFAEFLKIFVSDTLRLLTQGHLCQFSVRSPPVAFHGTQDFASFSL